MKKLIYAFMALATLAMAGCKDKNDPEEKKDIEIKKVADYLYEYEAGDYGTVAPAYVMSDNGRIPVFGCSAVRNGNFYGRNLDFNINELCEFVVHTKATATRKHASVGVVNPLFLTITDDMVKNGLPDSVLNFIPWLTMDGINDAGLVCNINVVNMADIKDIPHQHTQEGAPQIMVMNLIRSLLDNCGSVAEAKQFIEKHDIRPIPTTWDGHIMIADPTTTVIVEFVGGDQPIRYTDKALTEKAIMTNFYNFMYEQKKEFPPHACGMERFKILEDNYASSNSMEGMWELLKMVKYTQTYQVATKPFWSSEFYDKIPDSIFLKLPMDKWTRDKILEQPEPKKEVEAYEVYAATGKYKLEDGLWFTTHNSTYDIANKTLWVTIREKYDKNNRHAFSLN